MAQQIGGSSDGVTPIHRTTTAHAKKKGCKQKKCSHWKGGQCRCGRD